VLEQVCQHENLEPPQRFLLYKPKSNSLNTSTSSQGQDKKNKARDNSAATPPVHRQGVKPLTIRESIEIEHSHRVKLKELQEKQAEERLAVRKAELEKNGIKYEPVVVKNPEGISMSKYRLAAEILDDFEEGNEDSHSEEENYDE
jgi:hypothetical protein